MSYTSDPISFDKVVKVCREVCVVNGETSRSFDTFFRFLLISAVQEEIFLDLSNSDEVSNPLKCGKMKVFLRLGLEESSRRDSIPKWT